MAVDRLIALFVLELFCNVRGKRHLTDFVERGKEVFVAVKVHNSVAVVPDLSYLGSQKTVSEAEFRSGLGFFSGLTESFPAVAADLSEKKELDSRACFVLNAVDSRRKYARIVGNQQIALTQMVNNIIKMLV